MTEPTPYDADRSSYSRQALARLVLSDRAAGLADTSDALVVTRYDAYTAPGGRVSEALTLTRLAESVLADSVVYERERGSSWEDIGQYLGVDAAAAEERFSPHLDRWLTAFDVPYRLDESGRKRIPQLPTAAYDPHDACSRLDLWANLRLGLRADDQAVSAALIADSASGEVADPEVHEMSGWIRQRNLETFLRLLAQYVHRDFDETDWSTVALDLGGTDDEEPGGWSTYPLEGPLHSLDVRVAKAAGSDRLSVVLSGAWSAELRLRIDTLMAAFAAHTLPDQV
ncbi:hypothetical protein [Streptomyces sp. NPDC005407]|uniref:hypothetical protein n=1 Tax=Streptomyces sp. NPDC005407 TaxID=3155340 RepID=UPI0033BAD88E